MDVRQYYRKLRDIESAIKAPYVCVTSLETSDGGKPGVISEVTREQAARLIVEGRVTLSTIEEETSFFQKHADDKKAFEKADMARRLQVTIVSAPDEKEPKANPQATSDTGVKK
jgi:hypothetical protein